MVTATRLRVPPPAAWVYVPQFNMHFLPNRINNHRCGRQIITQTSINTTSLSLHSTVVSWVKGRQFLPCPRQLMGSLVWSSLIITCIEWEKFLACCFQQQSCIWVSICICPFYFHGMLLKDGLLRYFSLFRTLWLASPSLQLSSKFVL